MPSFARSLSDRLFVMFLFFQTIFTKVTATITSIIIAVGLVSAPELPPAVPIQKKVIEIKQPEPLKEERVRVATKTVPTIVSPVPKKVSESPVSNNQPVVPPPPPPTVRPAVPPPPPQPIVVPYPTASVKVLKVSADKSEIWASGFHYATFSFEYLVDNKPEKANVLLKSITPPDAVPEGRYIPTDKKFSYSTKNPGRYTLRFITDTGVQGEATIIAKEWINKTDLELVPIRTGDIIKIYDNTAIIPTVFLGSFRIKTNPDVDIKLYDCNLSTKGGGIYESYQIRIAGREETKNNNCFDTLHTRTDSEGLSEEFQIYLNNFRDSGKVLFLLNDITVHEDSANIYHRATSSLPLDLEVLRYK